MLTVEQAKTAYLGAKTAANAVELLTAAGWTQHGSYGEWHPPRAPTWSPPIGIEPPGLPLHKAVWWVLHGPPERKKPHQPPLYPKLEPAPKKRPARRQKPRPAPRRPRLVSVEPGPAYGAVRAILTGLEGLSGRGVQSCRKRECSACGGQLSEADLLRELKRCMECRDRRTFPPVTHCLATPCLKTRY